MHKKMDYRTALAAVVIMIALFIAVTTHRASAQQAVERLPNIQAPAAFEVTAG